MDTPLSVLLKEKGDVIHRITPNDTILDCVKKLNELGIGSLLVMEQTHLEGIITERDIIRKVICQKLDAEKTHIAKIMTRDLVTVLPNMTVTEAMRIITERRFRHLPVVENNKVLGLISIGDLTRWVMLAQENEISSLTGYIHGTTR